MQKHLALVVLAAASAFGQGGAGLGSISGEVKDPSGAAVPNAKVQIANDSNGVRRNLDSNSAGIFSVPALPPASGYTVTINAPGFAAWTEKDIIVRVGQSVDLSVALGLATAATEVNVSATAAALVDDVKSDVSQVIGNTEIQELPINGRRFDSFALLTPGVTSDGTFGLVTFRGMALGNSFLTDGNDTTNQYYQEAPGRTRIAAAISQDAVQEFQVINTGYLPEFGHSSGGLVNTVTKSGANDIHGTFFWFFRNRTLNARDRYASFNPPETRHQTGGSLGGAIKKDKLFYFLNSEVVRRHNPIASSITGAAINPATHGWVRSGSTGCTAPATEAQCAAADAILLRNFGLVDRRNDQELFFAKLDWRPTDKDSFSASGNYLRFISPNGIQTGASLTNGGALGSNADSTVRDRFAKFSYTHIVNSSMLNDFRFGWFKDRQYDSPNATQQPPFGLVTLSVGGISNLGISSSYPRLLPSEQRFQFIDNLSWTKGRHTMKFGIDISSNEDYTDQLLNQFGSYTYGSATTFAQDFSGPTAGGRRWQTFSQAFGTHVTDIHERDWSFFAQDQFRLTNKLTVNYGVRYDYSQVPQPTVVNSDYPQTGKIPSYGGQVGPRVGLAYSVNSKTVVRAGYGLFHQRYGGGIIQTLFTQNGRYQATATYQNGDAAGPAFPNRLGASDRATAGTVSIDFAAPDFRPNYTQNGDVSIEHQFTPDIALTVSYLYNRGFHIITTRDLNIGPLRTNVTYKIVDGNNAQVGTYTTAAYQNPKVDPRYSRILQVEAGGKSWYDGLAVQFRGKAGKEVLYGVSYTWSHALDLGQGQGDDNVNRFGSATSLNNLFNGDYRQDKASGQLDQRHRLVFYWVASHNFTRRTDAVSKYLINNWQLSGVTTLSSGRPTFATVFISTHISGLSFPFFSLNGFGGDTRVPFWPTNAAQYEGVYRADARITKVLPISERVKLNLNFEAFNVTNTPRDTSINHQAYIATNGVLAPSAGYGSGVASAGVSPEGTNVRRAQVSLRLVF